ncbi:MAG: sugar O-acetyltransferase [Synergistaceae bacterium]|nr:sugar O-acetyltransferase [Synergistaceae bacterium]
MNERMKMTAGELYNPADEELYTLRTKAHRLCLMYNQLFDTDEEERYKILHELLPYSDREAYFQGPIFFDYGINIYIGKNFYANFNTTILDICPVKIGDNVMLGTNVSLLTPLHPLRWQERNPKFNDDGSVTQLEYGKPISIGDNCWLASNVTVTGGVTIGAGCVIGAGSVVTRDIPAGVLAAGNPCKVIKAIPA